MHGWHCMPEYVDCGMGTCGLPFIGRGTTISNLKHIANPYLDPMHDLLSMCHGDIERLFHAKPRCVHLRKE